MQLDIETLEALRRQHPAWRLLAAESAALVASFLHRVFVLPNRRAIAQADLAELLEDTLYALREQRGAGVYLRQVDLPGIHSKFIEAQRSVLAELLDLALPPDAIDATAGGTAQFARRYGFLDKPQRVRFRWLCAQPPGGMSGDGDYTVSNAAFAVMNPPVRRVFVTENEINFLAFPLAADSLVVFGAGYGLEALAQAGWLATRALHYWGDIDTHGFAILDQLRAHQPHTRSLLMDRETLLAHRPQWTDEPQPTVRDLPRLNGEERALYDELRWLRLGERPVRLEQERIAFGWVVRAVASTDACRSGY